MKMKKVGPRRARIYNARFGSTTELNLKYAGNLYEVDDFIYLTSLTRAKCGIPSTLCWKIPNISGSTELFAL